MGPTIQVASVICGGPGPGLSGLSSPSSPGEVFRIDNTLNQLTPCRAYQEALNFTTAEILCMVHDDLDVHDEDWLDRISQVFAENPLCVGVGLGGAVGLGTDDLYRKPFNIWNLARQGYCSNQTDWETHGTRETGIKRVVVLEQFCMAVRVGWLRRARFAQLEYGWPVSRLTHHGMDMWLACEAVRDGKQLFMVGAACHHHGGKSSTGAVYKNASWLSGGSLEQDHRVPHRWLWEEYRDVLPLRIGDG